MMSPTPSVSMRIQRRLEAAGVRFFANDNISQYIKDGELNELIREVAGKFEGVLGALVIDTRNDPNSKGTAWRMAKMYVNEIMSGRYHPAPSVTAFPNNKDHGSSPYLGMLVTRAEIRSVCSHHHQPVRGVAYIGIIPTTKVIGLSKYVRIAQHAARRGTLQEELSNVIADAIIEATESQNVAVHIGAIHGCCENRGVHAESSLTQTTVLHGEFQTASAKKEFFDNLFLQGNRHTTY